MSIRKRKKIYVDVTNAVQPSNLSKTGFTRTLVEDLVGKVHSSLLLLAETGKYGEFRVVGKEEFMHGTPCEDECVIQVKDLGAGNLFLDIDVLGFARSSRSSLLPMLKSCGLKIASYICDLSPVLRPSETPEEIVLEYLAYLGTHLQYDDCILAADNATIDRLCSLSEKLGLKEIAPILAGNADMVLSGLGSIPVREHRVKRNVRQMVILTARKKDIQRTLPFIDAFLPFVEEVVLCCPDSFVEQQEDLYQGRLRIVFLTDSELLQGRPLPEDHQSRNFYLRCLSMHSDKLDDVFLMGDDDYRPLEEIPLSFFVDEDGYKAYYMYDIDKWRGPANRILPYDRGQISAAAFLKKNHYPLKMYGVHMPQIIDKQIYAEMLEAHSGLGTSGVGDEWSIYFNYVEAHYPDILQPRIYRTLGWPAHPAWCRLMYRQPSYEFENFYDQNYDRGRLFHGCSRTYSTDSLWEVRTKKRRYEREMERAFSAQLIYETYREGYAAQMQMEPSIMICREQGKLSVKLPNYMILLRGGFCYIRVSILGDLCFRENISITCKSIDLETERVFHGFSEDVFPEGRREISVSLRAPDTYHETVFVLEARVAGQKSMAGTRLLLA